MPEDMRCNDRRRSSLGAIQLFACRPTVGARREQNNRLRVSSLRLAGPDYQPPCRFFSPERLERQPLFICSDRYASAPSSDQVSYPAAAAAAAAAELLRCCQRYATGPNKWGLPTVSRTILAVVNFGLVVFRTRGPASGPCAARLLAVQLRVIHELGDQDVRPQSCRQDALSPGICYEAATARPPLGALEVRAGGALPRRRRWPN